MSETRSKDGLDRALASWPGAEKSQSDWDDTAAAIVDRIESGDPGKTKTYLPDETIFAAPVGQTMEDGHNSAHASPSLNEDAKKSTRENGPMSFTADREGERKSLQDLARLASLTPAAPSTAPKPVARAEGAKDEDSGLINLAALSAPAVSDSVVGPATPAPGLASSGLFDDEPNSIVPGPVSARAAVAAPISAPPASARISAAPISAAPVSAAPVSVAPVSAASAASVVPMAPVSHQAPKKKSGGAFIVIGALVGVAALAAGGAFVVRSQLAKPAAVAQTAPKAPEVAATTTAAAPKEDIKVAQAESTTPTDNALDPSQLPTPNAAAPKGNAIAKGAPIAAPKATTTAEPAAKKGEEKPEAPQMSAKDLPQATPGASGGLNDAMRQAAGPTSAGTDNANDKKGPEFAPGSVPQKPSQGALTGALGAVLPGARACLGPDDPVSRATVVFTSNGSVQSVSVSGGAAGKPSEGCIKGALSKAKLQPFAEATYTTTVTVRH